MDPKANREDVDFNAENAEALAKKFDNAQSDLDGYSGNIQSSISTAQTDFKGYYRQVFDRNVAIGTNDAGELSSAFGDAAKQVREMAASAKREQENRQKARDWEDRNGFEKFGDWLTNEQAPQDNEPAPNFTVDTAPVNQKEVPTVGGYDVGGISSAKPDNLTSATKALRDIDSELTSYEDIDGALKTFQDTCHWGTLDVSSVMDSYKKWFESNTSEYEWIDNIAEAFTIAGGSGNVSNLSNDAIARMASPNYNREDLDIKAPTVAGANPSSGYSDDPVNTATGNFVEREDDIEFSEASSLLTLTRMYNSVSEECGYFGLGWSSALESRLILDEEKASWVQPDGRHVIFARSGEGWNRATGYPQWLTRESSAEWGQRTEQSLGSEVLVVRDNNGSWWLFTLDGYWVAQGSGEYTLLTFIRNSEGIVTRIVHASGRFIDIEYRNSHVVYVQSSDGRRAEYFYENDFLLEVKTAAGSRRYEYNDEGRISRVFAASGVVEVENAYDAAGRISGQLTEYGRKTRYVYLPGGVTVVSDEDGNNSNTWVSDSKGRLISLTDASGKSQTMAYDSFGNRVSVTERDGAITVHAYDKRGRIKRSRTPEGADFTYAWDELDRVTSIVTSTGGLIEYEYESAERNPSVIKDALGGKTYLTWNRNLLVKMVGATGVSVSFTYDEFDEIASIVGASGHAVTYERDAAGRITEMILPSGASTKYSYDGAGNLVSRVDPDGSRTRFSYNLGGQLEEVIDPLGAKTQFEYGPHGQVEKIIDPLGRETSREFDVMGYVRSLKLPNNESWKFEYNPQGELSQTMDPLGNAWRYEYSAIGELSAVIDPTGVLNTHSFDRASGVEKTQNAFESLTAKYDEYGRLKREEGPDGSEEIYTHDAAGNVVEILDAEGGLTRIERNLIGAITAIISPEGRRSEYTYDACGRPEKAYEPTGEVVTLVYDADSRVVERHSTLNGVELYAYDATGRIVEQRTSTGARTRIAYDACGRPVFIADGKYGQRRFAYDAAGQLICVTSGLGGKTHFTYTQTGQVASRMDANGAVTRFEYNAADQVIKQTDGLGRVTTFTYDEAGRRTSLTDAEGNKHSFEYDGSGFLCSRTLNGEKKQGIVRDIRNRTVSITDYHGSQTVTHTLTYNRLGSLIKHETPDYTLSYTYNKDSQRTSLSFDDILEDYSYTAGGLLSAINRTQQSTGSVEAVHYSYDSDGQLVSVADQNENVLYRSQVLPTAVEDEQDSGQLISDGGYAHATQRKNPVTGELVETRTYYNQDGLVIGIDDSLAGLRLFSYNDAHLLTSIQSADGLHVFTYDETGFLAKETLTDGTVREYSYDAAGQLVAVENSAGHRIEYVYDGLGRRVRETESDGVSREFAFDEVGQLIGYTRAQQEKGSVEVGLSYDSLGQLASVAGVPLVFDFADSSLPIVLSMGGSLVPLATRVAGLNLTGDRGVDAFGVSAPVFVPEQLDTVESVVASATQSADQSLTGLADVNLALGASTGVLMDDLEILGARVYDPATRGFLSSDPLASPLGAGWSANVYAFAGFDPVSLVDPWGLSPVSREDFAKYAQEHPSGLGNWVKNNWQGVALIGLGIAATAFLGPVGGAVVGGALLSGGMSVFTSKNADGSTNWGKVGLDALIGGVAGGAGAGLVSAIGKIGFATNVTKGASVFSKGFSKTSQGLSYLDDAAVATAKSEQFAQKAASKKGWQFISKARNTSKAGSYAREAEALGTRGNQLVAEGNQLFETSAGYLDKARYYSDFANQKAGKALSGGLSGGIQNEYTYLSSDGHHGPLGAVTSFAGGTITGAVAPVAKTGNRLADFVLDRPKDYLSGVGNYLTRTNIQDWDLTQLQEKGVSSAEKGFFKGLGKEGNTSLKNSDKFSKLPFGK